MEDDYGAALCALEEFPLKRKAVQLEWILGKIEIELFNRAIQASGGNQRLAAESLGLGRTTFLMRIKKYGGLCNM